MNDELKKLLCYGLITSIGAEGASLYWHTPATPADDHAHQPHIEHNSSTGPYGAPFAAVVSATGSVSTSIAGFTDYLR